MIPTAFLQAWSVQAPWPDSRQIEQDLFISRALCDLFNAPALKDKIAFRGGTAIHSSSRCAFRKTSTWCKFRPSPSLRRSTRSAKHCRGLENFSESRQSTNVTIKPIIAPALVHAIEQLAIEREYRNRRQGSQPERVRSNPAQRTHAAGCTEHASRSGGTAYSRQFGIVASTAIPTSQESAR